MKKTFYLMMLTAALAGSQAFAFIPTVIEGATNSEGTYWDGIFALEGDAKGAAVTITASDQGVDRSEASVYGGTVTEGGTTSSDNVITMAGGEVYALIAGSTAGNGNQANNVCNNTVIMNGGKASKLVGGENNEDYEGSLYNNKVVIAGGTVGSENLAGTIWGGHNGAAPQGAQANNNTVSLIGKDASITIGDKTYNGGEISIHADIEVGSNSGSGNTLSIAGSGIVIDGEISGMQNLNFSLVDGLTSTTAMMVYNNKMSVNLSLKNVAYAFNGDAVADWSKYEGESLTLIESYGTQIMDFTAPAEKVQIMGADGAVLATADLELKEGNFSLVLANIHSDTPPIPEPATGTLSLLALAGLAARRRRK